MFFSGRVATVGCKCLLFDEDCAEKEAPASGKASRQDKKSLEEELPERAALVHRLRDHVSRSLNHSSNVQIMYTVMVSISGQFPRARSLCVQISEKFQGQEVQKGQRINERLMFDFQSLDSTKDLE